MKTTKLFPSCVAGAVALMLLAAAPSPVFAFTCPANGTDVDRDGLDDQTEDCLANSVFPTVHLHPQEACPWPGDRYGNVKPVLYRARPLTLGGVVQPNDVIIFYVLLYDNDCGVDFFGAGGHAGDNESFAIHVRNDGAGNWSKDYTATVAHWGAGVCESSEVTWGGEIWAGRNKHGNHSYQDHPSCFGADDNGAGDPTILSSHLYNVGEGWAPMMQNVCVAERNWCGYGIWNGQQFMNAGVITEQLYNTKYYNPGGWDYDGKEAVPPSLTVSAGGSSVPVATSCNAWCGATLDVNVDAAGGNVDVSVTGTTPGTSWIGSDDCAWDPSAFACTAMTSYVSGDGTASYYVAANTGPDARTGRGMITVKLFPGATPTGVYVMFHQAAPQ